MIKIQINRERHITEETFTEYGLSNLRRDQIAGNRYNIVLNVDNDAWHTVQLNLDVWETRDHIINLLQSIPFAKVEFNDAEVWERNILINGTVYHEINLNKWRNIEEEVEG